MRSICDFYQTTRVPRRAQKPVTRLSLDRIGVDELSEVVARAFARTTWFDLLSVLDGETPNAAHRAVADLAASGHVRAILTTNFDTLVERAMRDAGVPHTVLNTLTAAPPAASTECVVVKIHGTASEPRSLIDLSSQKRRGLPLAWLDWIEKQFATTATAVLGFSGTDLGLGSDYLRLGASSDRVPWLRWLVRPGSAPVQQARAVVSACGDRARFVSGELPNVLLAVDAACDGAGSDAGWQERLRDAVRQWLSQPDVDANVCGIVVARLLEGSGSRTAAAAVRSSLGTRATRQLRSGTHITSVIRLALVLAQIAADDDNPTRAISRSALALRALGDAVFALGGASSMSAEAQQELLCFEAATLQNLASCDLRLGEHGSAAQHLDEAIQRINAITGLYNLRLSASHYYLAAALALVREDRAAASELLGSAGEYATAGYDLPRMAAINELRESGGL